MVPERSAWPVNPAICPRNFIRFVERITDTVVVARAFADHHQPDFVLRIIDERVTAPGAGRERNGVALGKRMKHAVEPDMGLALEHVLSGRSGNTGSDPIDPPRFCEQCRRIP